MRRTLILLLIFANQVCFAESETVCVAPVRFYVEKGGVGAPGLYCDADKISLKIDERTVASPIRESIKLSDWDPKTRHRVTVFCGRRAEQSFSFRFSEFKGTDLCLFFNDLYRTVQLWDANRAPWCKCK